MERTPDAAGRGPASSYQTEAAAYLQSRLSLSAGVLAIGVFGLYVAARVLQLLIFGADPGGIVPLDPFHLLHLAAGLVVGAAWILLRREAPELRRLRALDAGLYYVSLLTSLALLSLGEADVVPFVFSVLCLIVTARAIVVPSDGRRTLLLSLPAVPILAVVLAFRDWPADTAPGDLVARGVFYVVILLLAIGLATVASRVNFTLRRQVHQARRVGPYEFVERIGDGAMGEVWRATHALMKRPTAIKLLRSEVTGPDALARFEREVVVTSRLTHPNTIRIYDYGHTADGMFYYAMEYLEGADCERIVKATGPLPPARAIHVLEQVAGALEEAHAAGLVHRDVKPGNLHLCRRGLDHDVVKVLDFGLVKRTDGRPSTLTKSGAFVGTPATGAPERFFGEDLGPSSDLYSLGATAFFLLTGRYPFEGKTVVETVRMHMNDEPPDLAAIGDGVPEDLSEIVRSCLAKLPADRPVDAAALRAALTRCRDHGTWTQSEARAFWSAHPALAM